jgi:hypothetical protein
LPHQRPTAEHAATETRPLFKAEGHDRDASAKATRRANGRRGVKCCDHTKSPVKRATIGRRVEVGAAPHIGEVWIRSRDAAAKVARGIHLDAQAGVPHPARDQLVGALLALAQTRSIRTRRPADVRELRQTVKYAIDAAGGGCNPRD